MAENWLSKNRWPWEKELPPDTSFPFGGQGYRDRNIPERDIFGQLRTTTRQAPLGKEGSAISFESVVGNPVWNENTKRNYIEKFWPDRLEEYISGYGSKELKKKYETEQTKSAQEQFKKDYGYYPTDPSATEYITDKGYIWKVEHDIRGNEINRTIQGKSEQAGMSDFEKAQQQRWISEGAEETRQFDIDAKRRAEEAQWQTSESEADRQLREQEMKQQESWRESQMASQERRAAEALQWQKDQFAQQQQLAQQQRLAMMAQNPLQFMQYHAESGQTPAVQEWMKPLALNQGSLQTGQALPGWNQNTGLQGAEQTLMTPSAQFQARMGPTALQQYYSMQQSRTGASPEEQQYRLWSGSAPGGRFTGLSPRR